jgi:hypothetical protein
VIEGDLESSLPRISKVVVGLAYFNWYPDLSIRPDLRFGRFFTLYGGASGGYREWALLAGVRTR